MSFDEQPDGDLHGECSAEIRRLEHVLRDIASMGRRMSYALKRAGGHDKLVAQCVDLFKRHGLGGNVLRALSAPPSTQQEPVAEAKAVGILTVGPHDHGPFIFRETAYGADNLATGEHHLYTRPVAAQPAEPAKEM